jgi:hypothetical protein
MKKFYMTIVAMLCGAAAMAQTCTLSAEDVAIVAGSEPAYLEVVVNESEPGKLVTGCGFRLELPEGISVYQYYDEDEEADVVDVEYPCTKKAHTTQALYNQETGAWTFGIGAAGSAAGSYFKTAQPAVLVKVGLVAAKDIANGEKEIKISNISFARPSDNGPESCYPQDAFVVKATVTGGTAINSIKAEDSNAPIYNIAGQRVSKAQKGVFIQNGKKIAVK